MLPLYHSFVLNYLRIEYKDVPSTKHSEFHIKIPKCIIYTILSINLDMNTASTTVTGYTFPCCFKVISLAKPNSYTYKNVPLKCV